MELKVLNKCRWTEHVTSILVCEKREKSNKMQQSDVYY